MQFLHSSQYFPAGQHTDPHGVSKLAASQTPAGVARAVDTDVAEPKSVAVAMELMLSGSSVTPAHPRRHVSHGLLGLLQAFWLGTSLAEQRRAQSYEAHGILAPTSKTYRAKKEDTFVVDGSGASYGEKDEVPPVRKKTLL